ncbi:TM2 domain-containing protein 3-like [Liolophura sinensis]|uniref:TM2 domain-containing protein 3-like n=1 Tax=Liolophura sinensis TaxID=3198878 RepID=UPI003158CB09
MGMVSKASVILYVLINVLIQWHNATSPTTDLTEEPSVLPTQDLGSDNADNSSAMTTDSFTTSTQVTVDNPSEYCPDGAVCSDLSQECLTCGFNTSCVYGKLDAISCTVKDPVPCVGNRTFTREFTCRFCYQMEPWLYTCSSNTSCTVISSPPRSTYMASCTVKSGVTCMGNRKFYKKLPCNWTSGYRWSTALALSITLGGLGADRFYLGLWREGLGKLFSFGGLGVWTLVDVILIAIGYIGPSDGTLYMQQE